LRVVAQDGVLPALRSLGIQLDSRNSPDPQEGDKWREDEDGNVTEADAERLARPFDGNYIMSLSKAAPNLEELELMGASDDTLASFLSFSAACCGSELIRCRIPSLHHCPGSPSYKVSLSLAVSAVIRQPFSRVLKNGMNTLGFILPRSMRQIMESMLQRPSMRQHKTSQTAAGRWIL